jgi:hypothetical protein
MKLSSFFLILAETLLLSSLCLSTEKDPIPKNGSIVDFFLWFITPAAWIDPNTSDKHDLAIQKSITSHFQKPIEQSSISKMFNDFWNIVKQGRYIAALTNSNFASAIFETLLETGQCFTNDEYTDPDLGHFAYNPKKWCSAQCKRFPPIVNCCLPQTPEIMDVKFILYVRGKSEKILNWRDPSHKQYLSQSNRVVYLIHGLFERVPASPWLTECRDAFLQQGNDVIIVDYRRAWSLNMGQVYANLRVIGPMVGKSILNWGIHARTLLVGFSLGGQILGLAGKYTQTHGNVKVDECHALDPAGAFFDECDDDTIRLSKKDCKILQVMII